MLNERIATLNKTYFSEIARVTVLTYCCLDRLHQVLISIVPYIEMPVEEHHDASQLIYELLRVIQLLRSNISVESQV